MTRKEFLKILAATPDDGHPYWPQKLPNEILVKEGEGIVDWLIEAIASKNNQASVVTLAGIGPSIIPNLTPLISDSRLRGAVLRVFKLIPFIHESIDHTIPDDDLIDFVNKDYSNQELDFHELQRIEHEQANAINILGFYKISKAVPALLERLNHPNYLCVCACSALARIKNPTVIRPLLEVLLDEDKFWVPRGAAANALGSFGALAKNVLPEMEKALEFTISIYGETWDKRAKDAVEDAINRIKNPNHESQLKGKGFKYEMWGIY